MLAPIDVVPDTLNVVVEVIAPFNTALPTKDNADELPLIAFAVTVDAVIVLAAFSTNGPSKVTDAVPGAVKLACKLILPAWEALPKVILVKLLPSRLISLLKISSVVSLHLKFRQH